MLWIRTEQDRLEGENELGRWSVTTYAVKGRKSTHVRLNGRIQSYCEGEDAGLRFVERYATGQHTAATTP